MMLSIKKKQKKINFPRTPVAFNIFVIPFFFTMNYKLFHINNYFTYPCFGFTHLV